MQVRLMNMVMIKDSHGKVLVLDKLKKEGWEGLTFPGGKTELTESMTDSAIREIKEETNLDIEDLKIVGICQWIYESEGEIARDFAILYMSETFKGDLIEHNREGDLSWIDYEEFKKMKPKSKSMNEILKVYDGLCSEVIFDLVNDRIEFR